MTVMLRVTWHSILKMNVMRVTQKEDNSDGNGDEDDDA